MLGVFFLILFCFVLKENSSECLVLYETFETTKKLGAYVPALNKKYTRIESN